MSDGQELPSVRIDESKPSVARAYDAFLDGKDNFEVDRHLVEKFLEVLPDAKAMARKNRRWLIRAVRWLADTAGIDQFLDCGSGLPTQENTHDVVQRVNPDARVVYVDIDPICAVHGRALLEDNDRTYFAHADLTEVESLFEHPSVTRYLDLTRPVALIHCSTIHHVSDEQQPYDIMQRYIERLPSVAIRHSPTSGTLRNRALPKWLVIWKKSFRNNDWDRDPGAHAPRSRASSTACRWLIPGWCNCTNGGPRVRSWANSPTITGSCSAAWATSRESPYLTGIAAAAAFVTSRLSQTAALHR